MPETMTTSINNPEESRPPELEKVMHSENNNLSDSEDDFNTFNDNALPKINKSSEKDKCQRPVTVPICRKSQVVADSSVFKSTDTDVKQMKQMTRDTINSNQETVELWRAPALTAKCTNGDPLETNDKNSNEKCKSREIMRKTIGAKLSISEHGSGVHCDIVNCTNGAFMENFTENDSFKLRSFIKKIVREKENDKLVENLTDLEEFYLNLTDLENAHSNLTKTDLNLFNQNFNKNVSNNKNQDGDSRKCIQFQNYENNSFSSDDNYDGFSSKPNKYKEERITDESRIEFKDASTETNFSYQTGKCISNYPIYQNLDNCARKYKLYENLEEVRKKEIKVDNEPKESPSDSVKSQNYDSSKYKSRNSYHRDLDEALSSLLWQPYEYQKLDKNAYSSSDASSCGGSDLECENNGPRDEMKQSIYRTGGHHSAALVNNLLDQCSRGKRSRDTEELSTESSASRLCGNPSSLSERCMRSASVRAVQSPCVNCDVFGQNCDMSEGIGLDKVEVVNATSENVTNFLQHQNGVAQQYARNLSSVNIVGLPDKPRTAHNRSLPTNSVQNMITSNQFKYNANVNSANIVPILNHQRHSSQIETNQQLPVTHARSASVPKKMENPSNHQRTISDVSSKADQRRLPLNVSNVNVNYYRAVPANVVSSVPQIQCVNSNDCVSNVNIVQAMPVGGGNGFNNPNNFNNINTFSNPNGNSNFNNSNNFNNNNFNSNPNTFNNNSNTFNNYSTNSNFQNPSLYPNSVTTQAFSNFPNQSLQQCAITTFGSSIITQHFPSGSTYNVSSNQIQGTSNQTDLIQNVVVPSANNQNVNGLTTAEVTVHNVQVPQHNQVQILNRNQPEIRNQQDVAVQSEIRNQQNIRNQHEIINQQEIKTQQEIKNQQEIRNQADIRSQQEIRNQLEIRNQSEIRNQPEIRINNDVQRTFTSTEAQTDDTILSQTDTTTNNIREQRRRERRERRHHRRVNSANHRHTATQDHGTQYNMPQVQQNDRLPDILNSHLPPSYSSAVTNLQQPPPVMANPIVTNAVVPPGSLMQTMVPGAVLPNGMVGAPIVQFSPTVVPGQVPLVQTGPPVAVPVAAPSGFRFPFQGTGFRRTRYSEESPKSCCGLLAMKPGSLRWFIALIAFVAVCCVLVGTVLGAMRSSGRDHLTVSLLMIGVGIVLITVSGIAWKLTSHDSSTCRSMLGLGSTESVDVCARRFVPRLPPSYGRPHHPYAAMMYPEFQYRPPPPSYQASMQEYRLRLLLLDRGNTPQIQAGIQNAVSPPPTYRSHAGSLLRAPLSSRRDAQSEYSCPPSYRSQTSSTRPNNTLPAPSILHSREQSLSLSESNHDGSVNVVLHNNDEDIALDNITLDSLKMEPESELNPLRMMLKGSTSDLEGSKDGNLVTIVQTSDQNPVIVTVSGSSNIEDGNNVQGNEIQSEMQILAHL